MKSRAANFFWKTCLFSIAAFPQSASCLFIQDRKNDVEPIPVEQQEKASQDSRPELDSRLLIGGNYTYLTLQPNGHQTFKGNLGGAQALYEFRPMNRFYGAARFDWREGNTHGDAGRRSILYFDGHERLGYTFANTNWRLTLFTGFGFHYLQQKLKPKKGDSVRFKYNEFYVPLGLLTSYAPNSWFSWGLDFTWMPQVFSTVSIAPLKGAHWNLTNRIDNFYAAMPLTFTVTKKGGFQIILSPFYEHWADGHSTAKTSNGIRLGLPSNHYNFYGVDLNFAYCF